MNLKYSFSRDKLNPTCGKTNLYFSINFAIFEVTSIIDRPSRCYPRHRYSRQLVHGETFSQQKTTLLFPQQTSPYPQMEILGEASLLLLLRFKQTLLDRDRAETNFVGLCRRRRRRRGKRRLTTKSRLTLDAAAPELPKKKLQCTSRLHGSSKLKKTLSFCTSLKHWFSALVVQIVEYLSPLFFLLPLFLHRETSLPRNP